MPCERCILSSFLGTCIQGARSSPDLQQTTDSNSEMMTRRREGQCGDGPWKSKIVEDETSGKIGENRSAIFIDRKKEGSFGTQSYALYVTSMRERKCIGLVSGHVNMKTRYGDMEIRSILLGKIEDGDPVAHWRKQTSPGRVKGKVPSTINGA